MLSQLDISAAIAFIQIVSGLNLAYFALDRFRYAKKIHRLICEGERLAGRIVEPAVSVLYREQLFGYRDKLAHSLVVRAIYGKISMNSNGAFDELLHDCEFISIAESGKSDTGGTRRVFRTINPDQAMTVLIFGITVIFLFAAQFHPVFFRDNIKALVMLNFLFLALPALFVGGGFGLVSSCYSHIVHLEEMYCPPTSGDKQEAQKSIDSLKGKIQILEEKLRAK